MSKYDKYIGELFDGVYKIEKIIGVGGMAVVFQAYDTVNDRVVAIKMLREEMNEKREYVAGITCRNNFFGRDDTTRGRYCFKELFI